MSESIKTLKKEKQTSQITVAEGWVRTKRDSKSVSFIDLNDGSCLKGLQVVADHRKIDSRTLNKITTGCSIKCVGLIVPSEGKDQDVEMQAEDIEILGEAPDTYPLQKKHHTLEYLREIAHLRPRTNTIGAVARVRSTMAYAVHKFFQEKGFYYVNTPIITASDAEGAGQMFQVTTLNFENAPKTEDGKIDWSKDFFGKKTNLTVSGQLEGESYACALRNIYTFGPTFRAENSNTKRHLAEFWMIEPEMAFCTLDLNIDIAEAFLKYIFKYTLDICEQEMDFFSKYVQEGVKETIKHVVETPFVRIKYTDAIKELEKASGNFEFKPYWGCDLQTEHERFLTEQVFKCPVAVTDYPKEIKSFYMKVNDDGKTVRAVDILVPRLGEIIGGSERENNLDKLLTRMKELSLNENDYAWYLDLRRYGTVPHSGFGLGFERAVQYVSGMQNIRDVIPFPRAVGQAEF